MVVVVVAVVRMVVVVVAVVVVDVHVILSIGLSGTQHGAQALSHEQFSPVEVMAPAKELNDAFWIPPNPEGDVQAMSMFEPASPARWKAFSPISLRAGKAPVTTIVPTNIEKALSLIRCNWGASASSTFEGILIVASEKDTPATMFTLFTL